MKTLNHIGIFLTLLAPSGPLVPSAMRSIRHYISLLFLCLAISAGAQTISRVTFPIDEQQTRDDLAKAGLDLSHGHG